MKKRIWANDSIWAISRREALNEKDKRTYAFLDSIGEIKKFDRSLKLIESLSEGMWPIGPVSIDFNHLLRFNDYENVRLGLGLRTNEKISKFFNIGGYVGYGFSDKAWKYGGDILFDVWKKRDWQVQFLYQNDVVEPGAFDISFNQSIFTQRIYAQQMDVREERAISLQGNTLRNLNFKVGLSQQKYRVNSDYLFSTDTIENVTNYNFSELSLQIRYAYGEQFVNVLGSKVSTGTDYPIIQLGYFRGLNDWLNGNFDYQKWMLQLEYSFYLRNIGRTAFRIEGGWVEGAIPFMKLFAGSGLEGGFDIQVLDNAFQTMDRYEFISDRFVNIYFKHNFGALLLKTKRFKPSFMLVHNMGIGGLKMPQFHKNIEFKTMDRMFLESGIQINDIFRFSYFNAAYIGLGIGGYYRYGYYQRATIKENLAFRLSLSFSL